MNLTEFLNKLITLKLDWQICQPRQTIRCRINDCTFCPITAVAKSITGNIYRPSAFRKAGKDIGLDEDVMMDIVDAADMVVHPNDNHGPRLYDVRERLIRATGAKSNLF